MKRALITFLLPLSLLAQTKPRNPIAPSGSWADGLIRAYVFSTTDSVAQDSVKDWSVTDQWGVVTNLGANAWQSDATHGPVFQLTGSNDFISSGTLSGISDSLTLFCVFNTIGPGSDNVPVANSDRLLSPDKTLYFESQDGTEPIDFKFGVYTSSLVQANSDSTPFDGTHPFSGWVGMLGTYDGSNIKVYRDGVLQDTQSQTGDVLLTSYEFWLGRSASGGSNIHWTTGVYALFMLWSRTLSDEEIAALKDDPYVMFRESETQNYYRRKLWQ